MKKIFTLCAAALLAMPAMFAQNPEALYLVGVNGDWTTPNDSGYNGIVLTDTSNDGVYEGTLTQSTPGSVSFKIFSAKSEDWENDCYGADNGNAITLSDNVPSEIPCKVNGSNITLKNWGTTGTLSFDWNTKKLTVVCPEVGPIEYPTISICGNFTGDWNNEDRSCTLEMTSFNPPVYAGSFVINESNPEFKLLENYSWTINYGNGAHVSIYKDSDYSGELYTNGGNIALTNWIAGNTLDVTFNYDTKEISLGSSQQPAMPAAEAYWLVGGFNGWNLANQDYMMTKNANGTFTFSGEIPSQDGALEFKITPSTSDWDNTLGGADTFALYSDKNYSGSFSVNAGNWVISNWEGGKLVVNLNFETKTVSIEGPDQPAAPSADNAQYLWLVGGFNGWNLGDTSYKLNRQSTTSSVYTGTFNVNYTGEDIEFKVAYGDDWAFTYGSENAGFALYSNAPYEGAIINDGSNWTITNWRGGQLIVTVDLKANTIKIEGPDQFETELTSQLYLIGAPQDWNIDESNIVIPEISKGVYSATVMIEENEFMFRFYSALGNWESNTIGAVGESTDGNVEIGLPEGEYTGVVAYNKNNWTITDWPGGEVTITVDLNNMTVEFSSETTAVDGINADNALFTVYNLQGVRVLNNAASLNSLAKGIYIVNGKKVVIR